MSSKKFCKHSSHLEYKLPHEFIKFYNERRIPGSLGFKTPNKIMIDYRNEKSLNLKPVSL